MINSHLKKKLVQGVGTNDADYVVAKKVEGIWVRCPFYVRWNSILIRCYSKSSHKIAPTYQGCSVSKEWLTFSNFKAWMVSQDWQNKQLDKDILVQGNKVYSEDTCIFVDQCVNALFINSKAARGKYPIGVNLYRPSGKFLAHCSVGKSQKHIGLFNTPQEAFEAYKIFKYSRIREVAMNQTEPLRSAMLSYKIEEYY